MPKLERVNQVIFANNSGSREITGFGTAKNSEPTYTRDLKAIQNANFLQGWQSAVLPDKAPYMEDTNALFYAVTRQLAYIFQAGLPEWNNETVYYQNDLCRMTNSANEVTIYKSLTNDNTGNNPQTTLGTYWKVFQTEHQEIALATYEIGLPQPTFSNNLYANEVWLEGQAVSRVDYASLFEIYGTTYGSGNGSTTFNLPDCRNRVMWGSTSFGYIEAGLPNITGSADPFSAGYGWNSIGVRNQAGAFSPIGKGSVMSRRETTGGQTYGISFNAQNANSIYGNSSTVQPPAIKVRVKTRWY